MRPMPSPPPSSPQLAPGSFRHRTQDRFQRRKRKLQSFLDLIEMEDSEKTINEGEQKKDKVVDSTDDGPTSASVRRAMVRREAKRSPRIVLSTIGHMSRLFDDKTGEPRSPHLIVPIDLFDMQAMILACIIPSGCLSTRPNLGEIQRSHTAERVGIFILEQGVPFEVDDEERKSLFQDVISYRPSRHPLGERLTLVPLTSSQNRKLAGDSINKEDIVVKRKAQVIDDDCTPATKTQLLMRKEQMKAEGYPDPDDPDFTPSREWYADASDTSPLFSLDCEMCFTSDQKYEVTKIIVINEQEEVVLQTLCLPDQKIIDYKTKFSGVREEDLEGVTTRVTDVRRMIRDTLPPDAILVGQSLESDLKALGLTHPYIIDTSVLFNLTGNRGIKTSLKNLAKKFLGVNIQTDDKSGHCPFEDAKAALDLVKLKMRNGLEFGDVILCPAKKSEWMKGKAHFMAIVPFVRKKIVEDFAVYYDFYELDSVSKFMMIVSNPKSRVKDSVVKFISSASVRGQKAICLVITFDGRCFISVK